jgi:uncharacterized hydantoinase/oxoprolinase family protein
MGRLASGLCGGMSEMREYDIFDMSDTSIHHLILNMLKGRPKAIENRTNSHTTLLAYLTLLVLPNANDIHLNPGPERDYLCGTCDKTGLGSQGSHMRDLRTLLL